MTTRLCPACSHVNDADAWHCSACGQALADDDTVPGALLRLGDSPPPEPHRESAGALWLNDLQPPVLTQTLDGADGTPFSITLRQLQVPPAPPKTMVSRRAAGKPPRKTKAPEPGPPAGPAEAPALVASDPAPLVPPRGPSEDSLKVRAQLSADPASRAEAKAAKRAAVRRARLGQAADPAPGAEPAVPEVLVVDTDDTTRSSLSTLLSDFGFRVHAMSSTEEAALLLASLPFVAAFVDVAIDGANGGAGLDLCQQVKQTEPVPGRDKAALVLVRAKLRPVERVRAKLAGCDAFLTKPVARGDVARALEACGVALPSDARKR